MKIILLQGSPNKNGSTNILAENFSKGAKEAGHMVIRFDFEDCGMVLGRGCGSPSMTKRTKYPEMAYQLGSKL